MRGRGGEGRGEEERGEEKRSNRLETAGMPQLVIVYTAQRFCLHYWQYTKLHALSVLGALDIILLLYTPYNT